MRRPRARRTRGVITWVLIVLASLLIPISVLSAWAIRTVTNTDQYVATMAPLARNPVIIDHLARQATKELFASSVVKDKVASALPAKAKPIIQPILTEVESYVYGVAVKVLESEQFGQLWDTLNRHTHDTVVDVLTGKKTTLTRDLGNGGQVVVNVTPILNNIIEQANQRGVTLFNPIKPILSEGHGLGITVVSKSQVSKFSGLFNVLVTLGWAVPVTALVLGILAIAIAVDRRRALLRLGRRGPLHPGPAGRAGFRAHHVPRRGGQRELRPQRRRGRVGHAAPLPQGRPALDAAGSGPGRPRRLGVRAGALRRLDPPPVGRGAGWLWTQGKSLQAGAGRAAAGSEGARRTGGWILEHLTGLRLVGVVVAALFLLFSSNLTGWALLTILIVLAVYLGLLQLVALWSRRITAAAAGARPA